MGKHITETHLGYTGSCYGPSPAVRKAMESSLDLANSYPYEGYTELKNAIASYSNVKPENVMVTNGCDEAIALITYLFGKKVLIQAPTYSEFERIAKGIGSDIRIKEQSIVNSPFRINFSKEDLNWSSLTWICTPNNPTGDVVPRAEILGIVKKARGIVAVDEAYYEYCNKTVADSVEKYKNLIVTRTFSKAFATEGIRLGYIISNSDTVRVLENSVQEYNVSRVARAAGIAVFKSMGYYKAEMERLRSIKSNFEKACIDMGFKLRDRNIPFTLLVFNSEKERDLCYNTFLKHGIVTLKNTHEEFTRFTDPSIRVAIGNRAQMEKAIKALKSMQRKEPLQP
ncbi:MAG: histidinol-phosphate transaminase [Methanothrix sp.]